MAGLVARTFATGGVALSEAIAAGDWRLFFLQRDRARKATLAEVQQAATTYLVQSNRIEGRYIPTDKPLRAPQGLLGLDLRRDVLEGGDRERHPAVDVAHRRGAHLEMHDRTVAPPVEQLLAVHPLALEDGPGQRILAGGQGPTIGMDGAEGPGIGMPVRRMHQAMPQGTFGLRIGEDDPAGSGIGDEDADGQPE